MSRRIAVDLIILSVRMEPRLAAISDRYSKYGQQYAKLPRQSPRDPV